MTVRQLDLEVQRKGRRVDGFTIEADPDDTMALREFLDDYLDAEGWSQGRRGEFALVVRAAGTWKTLKTVRAS